MGEGEDEGEGAKFSAAEISLKHTLPMADAIVYATAMKEARPVVTSYRHFKGLEDVIYLQA